MTEPIKTCETCGNKQCKIRYGCCGKVIKNKMVYVSWTSKTDKPVSIVDEDTKQEVEYLGSKTGNNAVEVEDKSAEYQKAKHKVMKDIVIFGHNPNSYLELEALAIAEGERKANEKNKCKSPCCQNCEWNRKEGRKQAIREVVELVEKWRNNDWSLDGFIRAIQKIGGGK